MMDEVQRNKDYKLIDLIKFLCAYLVIGIHTRPLQAVSVLLDKVVYYNISNYAVEYSCAVTPQVRQTGNRLSGLAGTAYASLFT